MNVYGRWATGFALLGLIWLLFTWRPLLGAALAVMLVIGVLAWQAQNKKGVFGGVQ